MRLLRIFRHAGTFDGPLEAGNMTMVAVEYPASTGTTVTEACRAGGWQFLEV